MESFPDVPGVAEFVDWFGDWPSFHDAEITRIHLNRSGASYMDVHVFRMTSQLSSSGHYVCDRHAVVTFELKGLLGMELFDFNQQNVLAGLTLALSDGTAKITLDGCHGAAGFLKAKTVSIMFTPGAPPDSQYLRLAT